MSWRFANNFVISEYVLTKKNTNEMFYFLLPSPSLVFPSVLHPSLYRQTCFQKVDAPATYSCMRKHFKSNCCLMVETHCTRHLSFCYCVNVCFSFCFCVFVCYSFSFCVCLLLFLFPFLFLVSKTQTRLGHGILVCT